MLKQLSLTNTNDIVCNSVSLVSGNSLLNLFDIFLTQNQAGDIVGIAPEELNTLREISAAIGNDPNFSQRYTIELRWKETLPKSTPKSKQTPSWMRSKT